MHCQSKETLFLEVYENGRKCAEADVTVLSPEEFVNLLDIQDMLGRSCQLKIVKGVK